MSFLILIIGFILLIKGADVFVEGASSIAKKFNVPSMIIGLTIVAMGTSAPEAAVSITSSLAGQNDMSVANVVGSNFFNILVVLGVSSIIAKLPVQKDTIKKDTPFLILISALLLVFGINLKIGRVEGLVLLVFFAYFLINTIKSAKNTSVNDSSETGETAIAIETTTEISMPKTILISLVGIVGIVVGGDMVVDAATNIAYMFGLSQNFVGLTIVAVGTSLPELVTSIVATKKGESALALGNAVGSNIFNILFILGMSAVVSPLNVLSESLVDGIIMVATGVLLFFFGKTKGEMDKKEGIVCILIYVAYTIFLFVR